MRDRELWPYVPTEPEWKDLPFEAAKAEGLRRYGTDEVMFIGHVQHRVFHFQVRGKGEFTITVPAGELGQKK